MHPSSEISLYKTKGFAVLLLVRKPLQKQYYLYTIDTITGSIIFDGIPGSSVFSKHHEAFKYIQSNYEFDYTDVQVGQALIGIRRYGRILYIAMVTESHPIARIGNRHTIFGVDNAAFHTIELPFHQPVSPTEMRRIERIKTFPIAGRHFWCETNNFATPLFSDAHDDNFVWNNFWIEEFGSIGQADACALLLQGTAISRVMTIEGRMFRMSLVTTREASHGGTRYYSRGMNETGNPANEVQCELIVEDDLGRLWEHTWRRGSVPIFWKTMVSPNLPTVSIAIDAKPARKTKDYFARLQKIFPGQIFCVNLLHNNVGNSEHPLCEEFANAIRNLENVSYTEIDWHQSVKEAGLPETVLILWSLTDQADISHSIADLSEGSLAEGEEDITGTSYGSLLFPDEKQRKPTGQTFHKVQTKLIRVNCLDSLDRTNVACFFHCAQVVSKILEEAGIGFALRSYDDLVQMDEPVRRFLSDAFIEIGDCISEVYTNTPACMTVNFSEVAGVTRAQRSDSAIAVQRRFHNLLTDKTRNKVMCLFSGHYLDRYLPNVDCSLSPKRVSAYPSMFMPPPLFKDGKEVNPCALLESAPTHIRAVNGSSLALLLKEFCYVKSIVIVLVPGNQPVGVSISTAATFGPKLPLVSKVLLPIVSTPTPVMIRIPPDYANYENPMQRFLYFDFDIQEKELCIGNIFVYGTEKQYIEKDFSSIYEDIPNEPDASGFQPIDTSTPEQLMKAPMTFSNVIKVETSRIVHKLGKLQALAIAIKKGIDTKDMSLASHIISLTPVFIEMNERCTKLSCTSLARWKCFRCANSFCERCSKQHGIDDKVYFASPVMICDTCYNEVMKVYREIANLSRGYQSFYMIYDPAEGLAHKWLLEHRRQSSNDYTKFPQAFVSDAADPNFNLVLTDEGGSMLPNQSGNILFGCKMHIRSVSIEGSDDCCVSVSCNGKKVAVTKTAELDTEGQIVWILVRSGELKKVTFDAEPMTNSVFRAPESLPPYKFKGKHIKAKQQAMVKNSITLIWKGSTTIRCMEIQGIDTVNAIVVSFYKNGTNTPSAQIPFYVPLINSDATDGMFMFPSPHVCDSVRVDFVDTKPQFVEPKIRLFS